MTTLRYFLWVSDEAKSAELQRDGARICEASLHMHHREYAILHEITPSQALSHAEGVR